MAAKVRKELLCNSEGTTGTSLLHVLLPCLPDWTTLCGSHWSCSLAKAPRIQKNLKDKLHDGWSSCKKFDFSLEHWPGKRHQNGDALSRFPCHQYRQNHMEIDPAKVFVVPAVVNSWVLPWTIQESWKAELVARYQMFQAHYLLSGKSLGMS